MLFFDELQLIQSKLIDCFFFIKDVSMLLKSQNFIERFIQKRNTCISCVHAKIHLFFVIFVESFESSSISSNRLR